MTQFDAHSDGERLAWLHPRSPRAPPGAPDSEMSGRWLAAFGAALASAANVVACGGALFLEVGAALAGPPLTPTRWDARAVNAARARCAEAARARGVPQGLLRIQGRRRSNAAAESRRMADRSRRLHPAHPLRRRRRVADSPADRFSAVEPSARVSRCGSGAFTAAGPITCTALTRAGKEDTGDGLFSPSGSPLESGSPRQLWSSTMRLQVTGAVSISMAQSRWKGRVTRPEERRLDRSTDSRRDRRRRGGTGPHPDACRAARA
jgi:hypothetical protein